MRTWVIWLAVGACMFGSAILAMWGIQTAWVGSFPGRDHAWYSILALIQFALAVVLVVASIGILVLHHRSRTRDAQKKSRDSGDSGSGDLGSGL